MGVVHDWLHIGAHPHRLDELVGESLAPSPLRHRDFGEDDRRFSELSAKTGVEGDRARFLRRSLRLNDVVSVHVHQGPRKQRMGALGRRRLRGALGCEHLFIKGNRRRVRPDVKMIAQRFA